MAKTITIKHLHAFQAVAHCKGFTRAAEHIHLSQPALTMAIRQLEDIVDTRLFERTTRGVDLTPEGSEFLPTAERLLREFDLAVRGVRAAARRRRGYIAIASVYSISTRVLPQVIPAFTQSHPGISMYMRDGNSSEVCRRVRQDEADIGFASLVTEQPEVDAIPLFRDQLGVFAKGDHPLFQLNRGLEWRDLDGYDFIGVTPDTATKPLLERVGRLPDSVTSPRYQVSNTTTLLAMVAAGNGITTMPALATPASNHGPVEFRPLSRPKMWRTLYAVRKRGRAASQISKDLLAAVRAHVRASLVKESAFVKAM
jgi:DNA-binding transcriptional LysR family regulator